MSVLDPLAWIDALMKGIRWNQVKFCGHYRSAFVPVGKRDFKRRVKTNIRSALRSRDRKRNGGESV